MADVVERNSGVVGEDDPTADWQAVFDGIGDGICLLDSAARVRRANRAFRHLVGLDEDEPSGDRPITLRPAAPAFSEADVAPATVGSVVRTEDIDVGGELPPAVASLVRELIEGRCRTTPATIAGRSLTLKLDRLERDRGYVLTVSETVERHRVEDEHRSFTTTIAEASQRKDEVLAMLAHELRNPLNAISASLHLQSIYGAQDERNQRLRDTASRQTAHLSRLVDDLLDASRVTKGAVPLHREIVDLVKVVEGAIEAASAAIDMRRHVLSALLPSEPVWIDGDAARLEQVVVNLLDNAAKYSEPGRRIWISLTANGTAELSVRDEGDGIAPEMQGAVFEMFRQEGHTLARSKGGLGIGLTVVRRLAEMHDGSVAVTSEGHGFGSTFTVKLPVYATERKVEVETPPAPSAVGATRILVVEDNVEVLEMMEMALEFAGYAVETASDGLTGLELALSTRPDVALVDVGLPGLDGYQLAQRVRADPSGKGVYMVAVTGYGRPEDRAQALRAGFDDHVVKPVRTARLLALVRNARRARHAAAREGT